MLFLFEKRHAIAMLVVQPESNPNPSFSLRIGRMSTVVRIRPVTIEDLPAWEVLYAGYAAFYKVAQTQAMRNTVWSWLMDPQHETKALVAVGANGQLIGLAHYRPFARPLSASMAGFLDDLFVDPDARGSGAADALLEALAELGRQKGWSVIRWFTAENNYRARAVYDRKAERTQWLTYEIKL
jgi:GNAT superfamily N-acetyltransferase